MTRFGAAVIALVCCVLAGFVATVGSEPSEGNVVSGDLGQSLAMTAGERITAHDFVVTQQLRSGNTYVGRTRDVYLVIRTTIVSERTTTYTWEAVVKSGDRTFKSENAVGVPPSGFKVDLQIVIEMPESDLPGAHLRLQQRGVIRAYETELDFDLKITDVSKIERQGTVRLEQLPQEEAI